jgi:hypothetical protein
MNDRPYYKDGDLGTSLLFTKKKVDNAIEDSIKLIKESNITVPKKTLVFYDGSEENKYRKPFDVCLHIRLAELTNTFLDLLYGRTNDECGIVKKTILLYWQVDFDEEKRYLLDVQGRNLCGMRLNDILEGKENYNTCPCLQDKDLKEHVNFCKKLTDILKKYNFPYKT